MNKVTRNLPFAVFVCLVFYYIYFFIACLRDLRAFLNLRALIGLPLLIWLIYDLWIRPPK